MHLKFDDIDSSLSREDDNKAVDTNEEGEVNDIGYLHKYYKKYSF